MKVCKNCGIQFKPLKKKIKIKDIFFFKKQQFCSPHCQKKYKLSNPRGELRE